MPQQSFSPEPGLFRRGTFSRSTTSGDAELVANYLSGNDLRVTAVATGAEMRRRWPNTPSTGVLDCVLRERTHGAGAQAPGQGATPIIIVTGKQDEADR